MKFVPFKRMLIRLESAKNESDLGYFFDLLLLGELLTKTAALSLVSAINDDTDRTRYRFEHQLARGNAIGDFAKIIDEIANGPSHELLYSDMETYEKKELTYKAQEKEWQYEAQRLLIKCFENFNIRHVKLPKKSPLRNWFNMFTILRNKTKGHGAPTIQKCSQSCLLLEESIMLIIQNFTVYKRPWAYLHRNLSGKFRISKITPSNNRFDYLKKEKNHSFENGIYIYLDKPRKVNLFYSDAELTDFWITNGNFKKTEFESISYISKGK